MDAIDAEPAKRNAPVNEQSRRMESVKRGVNDRLLSSSRYVSLAAALALALVHAPTARAGQAFDGPQAGGATLGAALVAGIVCWTVELGTQDRYRFDEVVEERDDDYGRVGWYGQLNALYALEVIDEGKEEVGMAESVAPEPVDFKLDSRHSGGIRAAAGRSRPRPHRGRDHCGGECSAGGLFGVWGRGRVPTTRPRSDSRWTARRSLARIFCGGYRSVDKIAN